MEDPVGYCKQCEICGGSGWISVKPPVFKISPIVFTAVDKCSGAFKEIPRLIAREYYDFSPGFVSRLLGYPFPERISNQPDNFIVNEKMYEYFYGLVNETHELGKTHELIADTISLFEPDITALEREHKRLNNIAHETSTHEAQINLQTVSLRTRNSLTRTSHKKPIPHRRMLRR